MPPVRTKRRTLSRRQIETQQVSPSRGRPRPRNQRRTTDGASQTSTSAAIVNVAAQPDFANSTDESNNANGSDTPAGCAAGPIQQSTAENNSPTTNYPVPSNTNVYTLCNTPIKITPLQTFLETYKEKEFLINGFQFGFQLQYNGPRRPREAKNLKSAYQHPEIVQQKINKELGLKRIGGPFQHPPFPTLQISPLGLVPKKDGDFRLIHHLSYPENDSINYYIDQSACSVHYSHIDDAAGMIALMGKGTLLAKSDIKSAFRLIPVAPSDFDLLGFKFS
ncbi:uncharacterized protein LOC133199935 [Saccostrea echinata]|uniref:uncharacterized protein LOC133199935 n=1 Tax=Saccostrea echinata TaxID=191078 RepID=UPI002A82F74E|nr:uncharacterized protein LOC133199935 [Saccostrea echinata]